MNNQGEIFRAFCKFVDERIFPEENMGTYVAFVVDQSFIDEFCKIHSLTESDLMLAVRSSLYSYRRDNLYVKGVIAIQLFAASKRANDGIITEKNYRDRLSQVLRWDIDALQSWMVDYQEYVWKTLYDWCDSHYFQITKCKSRTGTGRYVQYPVKQALRVFTEEDLRYIARCFVDSKLSPDEDIQKKDFQKIIGKNDIQRYIQTNHGRLVIKNSISEDDYYDQVFNFFLRWNGDYKEKRDKVKNVVKNGAEQLYLYLPNDFQFLEMRNTNLTLIKKFNLETTSYDILSKSYNFKQKGIILFKHDDVYDNYWQEVRFLEGQEEGLVICYHQIDSLLYCRLSQYLIYRNKFIQIFKIKYDNITRNFYGETRPYKLYGGLKIGRQTYLHGAAPTLILDQPIRVWIDGISYGEGEVKDKIPLNNLIVGHHYIKIPNFKKLEFEIVKASADKGVWLNTYSKWQINNVEKSWENCKCEIGIVGLDFSSIPQDKTYLDVPPLRRWTNMLTYGHHYINETNVTLRILKEQNNGRI